MLKKLRYLLPSIVNLSKLCENKIFSFSLPKPKICRITAGFDSFRMFWAVSLPPFGVQVLMLD